MDAITIELVKDIVVPIIIALVGSTGIISLVVKHKLDKHERQTRIREEQVIAELEKDKEFKRKINKVNMEINDISFDIEKAKFDQEVCHQRYQDAVYESIHTGNRNGPLTKAKKLLDCSQDEVATLYRQKKVLMEKKTRLYESKEAQ